MEKKLFLYSLNDPFTDEVRYIGITVSPKSRLKNHITDLSYNKEKCEWIRDLLSKKSKPVMKIISESSDVKFILSEEKRLISEGTNLLNISKGGEWNYCVRSGNRMVKMYNLDGELVQVFSSNTEAARFLNLNAEAANSGIGACARRVRNIAYGYIWRYDDDVVTPEDLTYLLSILHDRNPKICFQYDYDGVLVEVFSSIEKAAKALEISAGNIKSCLRNDTLTAGNFIFTHSEEEFEEKYKRFLEKFGKIFKVVNLENEETKYFKTMGNLTNYYDLSNSESLRTHIKNGTPFKNLLITKDYYSFSLCEDMTYLVNVYKDDKCIYTSKGSGTLSSKIKSLVQLHPEFIDYSFKIGDGELNSFSDYLNNLKKKTTSKKVQCLETGVIYESCKQAADDLGLCTTSISRYLKGRQKGKIKNMYSFKFV